MQYHTLEKLYHIMPYVAYNAYNAYNTMLSYTIVHVPYAEPKANTIIWSVCPPEEANIKL